METFEKDIDIIGGIATKEEGTVSGLLTIYGEVTEDSMLVQVGYGFDTPRFTVGTLPLDRSPEEQWGIVCSKLESEPEYDENGNVVPRTI